MRRDAPKPAWGVLLGDVDGDADLDMFMTHLRAQTNTLYRNQGGGYLDDTATMGLALPSLPWTGFGTRFLDLEMDGDLDLLLVNGRVARRAGRRPPADSMSMPSPRRRSWATGVAVSRKGPSRFPPMSSPLAGVWSPETWDRAGDLDIVVTAVGGPARLLENRSSREGGFLIVEPREFGRSSPARSWALELGDRTLVRALNPEAGYSPAASRWPTSGFRRKRRSPV